MGLPRPFGTAPIDLPESAGMTYGCHNSVRTVGYWVKDQVAVIPGEAFGWAPTSCDSTGHVFQGVPI